MSTILDALSRAERERQMGAAPRIADTLRTAPDAGPGPTRQFGLSGRAVVVGGALLAVAGAVWLWLPQPSQPLPEPQTPAVDSPSSLAPRAISTASLPVQDKHTGAPASASAPAHLPAASHLPSGGVAATPSATVGQRLKPAAKHEDALAVVENKAVAHTPPAAQASAVASAPASVASSAQAARSRPEVPKGKDEGAKSPAGKDSAPAAAPVLPTMAELPDAMRAQLPALAVNGYIYAASPKDRSIILNGRLLHEGEDAAPGLKLEQMRPDGVVLEFKGQRFRMAY